MFTRFHKKFDITRFVFDIPKGEMDWGNGAQVERPVRGAKSKLPPGKTEWKPKSQEVPKTPEGRMDKSDEAGRHINPGERESITITDKTETTDIFPALAELYGVLATIEKDHFFDPLARDGALNPDNTEYNKMKGIIAVKKDQIVYRGIVENWTRESIRTVYTKEMDQYYHDCTGILKNPGRVIYDWGADLLKLPIPKSWTDGIEKFKKGGKPTINKFLIGNRNFYNAEVKTQGDLDREIGDAIKAMMKDEIATLQAVIRSPSAQIAIKATKKKVDETRLTHILNNVIPVERELRINKAIIWNDANSTRSKVMTNYHNWLAGTSSTTGLFNSCIVPK